MAYSDFTIEKVKTTFGLTIVESVVLFTDISKVKPSALLSEWLFEYAPLATAINTEKARSEFLIAPILAEVRKQLKGEVALFSGVDFNVDVAAGLSGFCDYLISGSPEQLYVDAPVVTVVEAKNENIKAGLGQCIAEMIAAQLFNHQKNRSIQKIYGTVTTGQVWKFLKLEENKVTVDINDYYINDVGQILGIFVAVLSGN